MQAGGWFACRGDLQLGDAHVSLGELLESLRGAQRLVTEEQRCVCDVAIASDKAQFGQVGPRVGSVDPGWGTAYLSRIVGEKGVRSKVVDQVTVVAIG